MAILSIQSHVVFGHVGNSAAVFPLQRLGYDVWPLHTVQFSNHTGYEKWRGQVFTGNDINEIVKGIDERGQLENCNAVLSGYMGDVSISQAILDSVKKVKQLNNDAVYCCDPVLGDVDLGVYVQEGIPEFMKEKVIPEADIITPNFFELEQITGCSPKNLQELVEAARKIMTGKTRTVVVTSVLCEGVSKGKIATAAVTSEKAWIVETPLYVFEHVFSGGGDAFASLFLGHYLKEKNIQKALEKAVSSLHAIVEFTKDSRQRELQVVAAQEQMMFPSKKFKAKQI